MGGGGGFRNHIFVKFGALKFDGSSILGCLTRHITQASNGDSMIVLS